MSESERDASRVVGSGREALLYVRYWSGGTPRCPGVVRNPSRMTESGQEALLDVRQLTGGPHG